MLTHMDFKLTVKLLIANAIRSAAERKQLEETKAQALIAFNKRMANRRKAIQKGQTHG